MGSQDHHGPAITGLKHVAARVSFALHPPASVNRLPLRKIEQSGQDAALLLYGHGLGTIAVIESKASAASSSPSSLDGLSLPTHTVDGASATVLSTPLGTVLRFTKGGIGYTVVGSVTATDAEVGRRGARGRRMTEQAAPPIEVRGLVKRYGTLEAVAGVDLTVNAGDVYGYRAPTGRARRPRCG